MNKQLEQLKALTQVLSYTLGKFNVEVTVSGGGAYHAYNTQEDKHYINLPQGDFTDAAFREMSLGFIYHEIGHGINTDYSINTLKSRALHELHNALEDVWQERATGRRSPGAKARLARLAELGRSEGLFAGREKETPYEALLYLALYRGRTRVLGNPFHDFAEARESEMRNMIGDEITDKVINKIDEIETCENTLTALNIATDLMDLIQQEQQKHEQQQQKQESGDAGENEQTDSNSQNTDDQAGESSDESSEQSAQPQSESNQTGGQNSSDESSGETSKSDGDSSSGKDGSENHHQEGNDAGNSSDGNGSVEGNQTTDSGSSSDNGASSREQPTSEQIQKALEQMASGAGAENVTDFHVKVARRLGELAEEARREGRAIEIQVPAVSSNHPVLKMELNSTVQRNTAQVFSVLNRVLVDQARTLDVYTRQGKSLVSKKLAGVQAGDFNAFLKKGKSKSTTAAVSLAVDMSGSMNSLMSATNGVAYAFAQGLSKGGVPIEVLYFGGSRVYAAKRFSDKRPSPDRFGVRPGGGTPTGEAIQASLMSLMQQNADNKLMFVITDGKPQCEKQTATAIEYAQVAGVKVVPIFIGIKASQTRGFDALEPIEIDGEAKQLISQLKNAVKRKLFQ